MGKRSESDPAGVVAACNGYLETFGLEEQVYSLGDLARLIARLAEAGYVVALDEFQYFHRKPLFDFCSLLQAEVDRLRVKTGTHHVSRPSVIPAGTTDAGGHPRRDDWATDSRASATPSAILTSMKTDHLI